MEKGRNKVKEEYVEIGMEVDWYAIDKKGNMGHFSTAGWGGEQCLCCWHQIKAN